MAAAADRMEPWWIRIWIWLDVDMDMNMDISRSAIPRTPQTAMKCRRRLIDQAYIGDLAIMCIVFSRFNWSLTTHDCCVEEDVAS